jgi:Mg/Co/Ni transporter MgtE
MNTATRPFTALFVVDDARMVKGIIHIHDLLRAGLA